MMISNPSDAIFTCIRGKVTHWFEVNGTPLYALTRSELLSIIDAHAINISDSVRGSTGRLQAVLFGWLKKNHLPPSPRPEFIVTNHPIIPSELSLPETSGNDRTDNDERVEIVSSSSAGRKRKQDEITEHQMTIKVDGYPGRITGWI